MSPRRRFYIGQHRRPRGLLSIVEGWYGALVCRFTGDTIVTRPAQDNDVEVR